MKKLAFTVLKSVFLGVGIALFAGSCFAPINTEAFLEDKEVVEIVENGGSGGGEGDITLSQPSKFDPKLGSTPENLLIGTGTTTEPYKLELSSKETDGKPKSAKITITNYDNVLGAKDPADAETYTNSLWRCEGQTLTIATDKPNFTADVANEPFKTPGKYQLSIRGKLNNNWYSTEVLIDVVD